MELNKLYTIRCHFNINIILYNHFKFEWSSKFNHLIRNHFFYNQLRIDVQALISLKSSWLKGTCMNHTVWYLMVMILLALRNVYQTYDRDRRIYQSNWTRIRRTLVVEVCPSPVFVWSSRLSILEKLVKYYRGITFLWNLSKSGFKLLDCGKKW